ncbi:hypothetical protein ANANG_G00177240 [Anguilla anguilla]|uniref:Uncharacterized protein n=1 Tax=Anguilla anguilla TaxID=7936 RepID=A0A9D3RTE8_ANGAN|nr:hypothetical protein ANANG_G00177240 [Anguilla anguilla]
MTGARYLWFTPGKDGIQWSDVRALLQPGLRRPVVGRSIPPQEAGAVSVLAEALCTPRRDSPFRRRARAAAISRMLDRDLWLSGVKSHSPNSTNLGLRESLPFRVGERSPSPNMVLFS